MMRRTLRSLRQEGNVFLANSHDSIALLAERQGAVVL
jgi:hypothetical protein